MENLEKLYEEKRLLLNRIAELDKKINEHPEKIKSHFGYLIDRGCLTEQEEYIWSIINRISYIENVDGIMETRKDKIPWNGVKFTLDGIDYWYRDGYDGGNYELHDCGEYGDKNCPDLEQHIAYRIWYEKDTYTSLDNIFVQSDIPDWEAIGYLMWAQTV